MPDMQQWLEKQLRDCPPDPELVDAINAQNIAEQLFAAWPSSPWGEAVKALVEAAEYEAEVFNSRVAKRALAAARKAGMA